MPSGSKKRKAAKKKKEIQSSNHSNSLAAHSHGVDDVKQQEDSESDVGEISCRASQDHHNHQNHSTDGEEEGIRKAENISNIPSVEGLKNAGVEEQKLLVEEGNVVQAGKEFTIKDESDNKNGKVEHDEPPRRSYDGGMSGSSSSCVSSDSESHGIEDKKVMIVNVPAVDSVKSADSLLESPLKAVCNVVVEEAGDSVMEKCPAVDMEKILLSGEKEEISVSGNSVASYLVDSAIKENGEKTVSSIEYKFGGSEGSVDAASMRKEEEAIVQSVENAATISESMEPASQDNYDRMALSYNASRVTANNGGASEKDSGVTEPWLSPAPHPVQTTSWKSCCGLFEVFTGSGR